MKRIVTLVVALMLMLSLCVPAMANPGEFVNSPSLNRQPRLISYRASDAAWNMELIITAYADRATLPEDCKANFEAAYQAIAASTDLSVLIPGAVEFTEVAADELAISDLFHIHEAEKQERTGTAKTGSDGALVYTMTVECNTMNAFEALVQYTENGWVIVENATEADGQITYETEELGVFAVVVKTDSPEDTGDGLTIMFAALMIVAAAGIAVLLITKRKNA